MEIIDILFRSLFFGFTTWTIFWVLTKKTQLSGHRIEEIDTFVVRTIIVLGIIHIIFLASNLVELTNGIGINKSLLQRAFGKYWFGFWMYPITYFGLTQLLWFYKIRKSKPIRIIIASCVFITMHFEKFVIFVTALHRDFSPGGDNRFPVYILQQVGLSWLIAIPIFTTFIIVGLKIKNAIQQKL